MSREHIASVLKKLRQRSGLSADEVGRMISKSAKTIYGWENSHGQPDAETLMLLCEIYNVSDILNEFRETASERNATFLNDDQQNAINLYSQLDTIDRAEIRGMMKQMLRADKYSNKSNSKLA